MKNFEHYKDVFMRCKGRNLECVASKEILKRKCDSNCPICVDFIKKWLYEEYKEPIKITEDEKVILRNLPKKFKWIVRFEDFNIPMLSEDKPYKRKNNWFNKNGFTTLDPFGHLFKFIKYDDEEPYSIEELLKEE